MRMKQIGEMTAGTVLVVLMVCQVSVRGVEADNSPVPLAPPAKSVARAAEAPVVVSVWSTRKMPGVGASKAETNTVGKDGVIRVTNVSEPTLTVFRAPSATASTPAVIICPGGAYHHLTMNKEGSERPSGCYRKK